MSLKPVCFIIDIDYIFVDFISDTKVGYLDK